MCVLSFSLHLKTLYSFCIVSICHFVLKSDRLWPNIQRNYVQKKPFSIALIQFLIASFDFGAIFCATMLHHTVNFFKLNLLQLFRLNFDSIVLLIGRTFFKLKTFWMQNYFYIHIQLSIIDDRLSLTHCNLLWLLFSM